MKNLIKYQLIVILFMVYSSLSATDWNKTNKNFRYDKDVDASMSADYTRSMTTVSYHGTLFNFVNYRASGSNYGSIIQRKISPDGDMPDCKWDSKKTDDINYLDELDPEDWQPAAVVFRDSLLLFVSNNGVRYVLYDPSNKSWSAQKPILYPTNWQGGFYYAPIYSHGAAAVVLDDKLCLITHDHDQNVMIHWTKDLKTWNNFTTNVNIDNSSGENDYLSAVTTTFTLDSKKKSKLMFAWLNGSKHPCTAEYYFSNDSTLTHLRTIKISDQDEYSSVALAVGTISCPEGSPSDCVPDRTSTGECVQAFLKRDSQDNSHNYYRIKRFQFTEADTVWSKIENNLVPQNAPNHYWASREIPLTVAVLQVPDKEDIRQFMCLVYRGYDNWNYPMNIAWAETNRLVYIPSKDTTQILDDPELTQYIGYIEGPPPFHLNNMPMVNPYKKDCNQYISEIEFKCIKETNSVEEMGYDVEISSKNKIALLNLDLTASAGQIWQTEKSTKVFHSIDVEPQKEGIGYYLIFQPSVTRTFYEIQDVQKKVFGSFYYYYMNEPSVVLI